MTTRGQVRDSAQPSAPAEVTAAGDTTLVVTLGTALDRATSRRVLHLAERIKSSHSPGIVELVPAAASLTVHVDPDVADLEAITKDLARWAATNSVDGSPAVEPLLRRWSIPVCYDPAVVPAGSHDLDQVASQTGLTRDEIIGRHAGTAYHVYMLGFMPGFPYMGDLDPALRLPRRSAPRTAVPAGSVAIAAAITAIYPAESPGGWHILGRTSARLFDAASDEPALLQPGDEVVFRAVSPVELEKLQRHATGGAHCVHGHSPATEAPP